MSEVTLSTKPHFFRDLLSFKKRRFLKCLRSLYPDKDHVTFQEILDNFEIEGGAYALTLLPKEEQWRTRDFALDCAEQVLHIWEPTTLVISYVRCRKFCFLHYACKDINDRLDKYYRQCTVTGNIRSYDSVTYRMIQAARSSIFAVKKRPDPVRASFFALDATHGQDFFDLMEYQKERLLNVVQLEKVYEFGS